MPDGDRPLIEELLDFVVYAPIGVLSGLAGEFPSYVERGRRQLERQVNAARLTGRIAVGEVRRRVEGRVPTTGGTARTTSPTASEPMTTIDLDPDDLAIPGYDALAASQVVARLAGLSKAERAAVRRYEAATRGRRTIIGRLDQLDADS